MATRKPALPAVGESQTIPARHGVATFVPRGHTVTVRNTYGSQVVDMWAFALHEPPRDEDIDEEGKEAKEEKDAQAAQGEELKSNPPIKKDKEEKKEEQKSEKEKTAEGEKRVAGDNKSDKEAEEAASRSWSSYMPTLPTPWSSQSQPKEEKAVKERNWGSYLPSGVGFSSYVPSKATLSAFAASRYRDPDKSYKEQLYDFSKTPVGAASLSGITAAASGGGYAGSIYAAYTTYSRMSDNGSSPGMEFLSMAHTRDALQRLIPGVGDTLVSNLRAPLLTLLEDTSPGTHDTLMAACDPQLYKELGLEDWEAHGSCAENLVLALKELNERNGLKGKNAVGSDVSVNSVPAPLHLFMSAPWTEEGDVELGKPQGKRGDYVKFRAERNTVLVMSACPQDMTGINGKRPMAANFVVEAPSEDDQKATEEVEASTQNSAQTAQGREAGKAKEGADGSDRSQSKPQTKQQQTSAALNTTGDASANRRDSVVSDRQETPATKPKAARTSQKPAKPQTDDIGTKRPSMVGDSILGNSSEHIDPTMLFTNNG
ncbi:hypothetical protein EJ06DRAFT_153826 [Trichodelitschia bisporula]|uniref:DUF1989 domain-containing protein n=1 Tax=Trichodelitschia bisporula TaxID=703511 RepID=A0A6G1HNT8_9PEZI|nr:hypothetical protein EJ06DRAFT_153826 [Trichodelitschia bisporula]